MITKLAEFLSRRSKTSPVPRRDEQPLTKGLKEAARIFFGEDAGAKIDEYFRDHP